MPKLQTFLECVGKSIEENGGLPRQGFVPFGDELLSIIRNSLRHVASRLTTADLRTALREAVSAPHETVDLSLSDALIAIASVRSDDDVRSMTGFLELLAPSISQLLRRPGDTVGTSIPEQMPIEKLEDWLDFFPDRMARFKPGEELPAFDEWQAVDLRGFGPHGETWRSWAANHPDHATASLKFVTDPEAAADFGRHEEWLRTILELEPMSGLVQLRSVYLQGDPPCLESSFVSGYDATALLRDWRWRGESSKPDQASLIVKRVAKIVGVLHQLESPIVHRGLKPSNILLHPTAEGKVTVWVSDIGWGAISSARMIEGCDDVQTRRQSRRGAYAPLYASPQQIEGGPADPRDDIYALGVIWYQLLKRDPAAPPPVGHEWAMEFRKAGLSDGHARLLASCLEKNPDHRPANGLILAAQIDANFGKPPQARSNAFNLNVSSGTMKPLSSETSKLKPGTRAAAVPPVSAALPNSFTNSLGMGFVLIPVGSFVMGSPPDERGRHDWEGPLHTVQITRPFYIGIHPVTQGQYQQLLGRNPSHFTATRGGTPDHPVEQVSWEDAVAFCERLTAQPAEAAECRRYRLPSEAEWEYACRAGTATPYYFSEAIALQQIHYFGLKASTGSKVAGTAGKTERVGTHPANAWGLFDVHGNVLEWCNDWWSEEYYTDSPDVDPIGPRDGWQRVARGGSFSQFAADCRSAARLGRASDTRLNTLGFRIAMTIPGT